ncbi:glycosyltransferase family 2 protein [Vibrio splendidus]|uniref:glycosyltransferase family 2 protein n=1 Tax=Vibrio splendidus TaxID=29497 RepID=UPI00148DDFFB|nr:glycosyltransferase family 2 protein [Vibrio splendidus]NOJ10021.1 glycosyltransferase family 2 protein [Vibrio splendidus]
MLENKKEVSAIIITFNPVQEELKLLVDKLKLQVSKVYIIDNNSSLPIDIDDSEQVDVTFLLDNMGIAYAQNIGINKALNEGFIDFILFDQDSVPSESMVNELFIARQAAQFEGQRVAAVGPVHIDQDTFSECLFIRTSMCNVNRFFPSDRSENIFSPCDFLIASGCLISKTTLDDIGYMEEELFIDCVDIEWGFRAKSKDYVCIAAFNAKMYHKVGGAPLKVLGQSLTTHSPVRHYYYYRNFYRLLQRTYIPLSWKVYTLIRSSLQALIFCVFLKPRLQHFKCIVKGIFHGLIGRSGRYE